MHGSSYLHVQDGEFTGSRIAIYIVGLIPQQLKLLAIGGLAIGDLSREGKTRI